MLRYGSVAFGVTLAAMGIVTAAAVEAAPTARDVIDRAKTLDDTERNWTDRTRKLTLHIHGKRGGERQRVLKVYDKRFPGDEDRSISFFLSPAEVKGTGFLQWAHKQRDDDQWLYLPELKRTRRITSQLRDQPFMGTDFSYRDLEILGEIQDWTEDEAPTKLLGEERIDGHPCHKIEFRPQQDGMSYGRIVMWMDREQLVPRKMDFFDTDDQHVKTLTLMDIRNIGPIPIAHRLEMKNLKKGSHTVVELADVAHDQRLADDLFTKRHLERGAP
jgi:outer membrane lipoprotein-sorting protein